MNYLNKTLILKNNNIKPLKVYENFLKLRINKFSTSKSKESINTCKFIKPKIYSDVNLSKPKDYYDFENMQLQLG